MYRCSFITIISDLPKQKQKKQKKKQQKNPTKNNTINTQKTPKEPLGYFIFPLEPWIVSEKQIDNVKIHKIKRGVLYSNFDLRIKRYIFVMKTM